MAAILPVFSLSSKFVLPFDEGEMLGYERAASVFAEVAQGSPEEIIVHLRETCKGWSNGR